MNKRIEVTPSSDGTIVLVCGDDVLEIVVKDFVPPRFTMPTVNIDRPYTFSFPTSLGVDDVDAIVEIVAGEYESAQIPDFRELVVEGPTLDIHGVTKLADRLNDRLPDLALAVAFHPKPEIL